MRILLIEDDASLAKIISIGLRSERFIVDNSATGTDGVRNAMSQAYDLIILDLMLPDKNGDEVCRQLRNSHINTPIIVLTALGDLNTKIKLFNIGADDYLTKPFEFQELLARIRACIRKQKVETESILKYSDLVLDMNKHEAQRNGQKLNLREKEIKILEYLMRHPEQVLTREMILNYVWGPSIERYTNVVDVHIHHLRDKIDKPYKAKLLKTVSTVGYKISR